MWWKGRFLNKVLLGDKFRKFLNVTVFFKNYVDRVRNYLLRCNLPNFLDASIFLFIFSPSFTLECSNCS